MPTSTDVDSGVTPDLEPETGPAVHIVEPLPAQPVKKTRSRKKEAPVAEAEAPAPVVEAAAAPKVLETVTAEPVPDPNELSGAPEKPKRGWWRR